MEQLPTCFSFLSKADEKKRMNLPNRSSKLNLLQNFFFIAPLPADEKRNLESKLNFRIFEEALDHHKCFCFESQMYISESKH